MENHGASEEFGKDLGLVHEVIVTGRKVGADREFWKAIAHDADLFQKVVDLVKAENIILLLSEWSLFYRVVFGVTVYFTDLQIPEKHEGFSWLLCMVKGATANKLFDKCKELFPAWKFIENLDTIKSVRSADKTYAVWVRNKREADEENKNKSANDCDQEGIKGITLEERLLLELFYYWRTGKHLDIENTTLCSGSRTPNGNVPDVNFCEDKVRVDYYDPDSANENRRVRSAVS